MMNKLALLLVCCLLDTPQALLPQGHSSSVSYSATILSVFSKVNNRSKPQAPDSSDANNESSGRQRRRIHLDHGKEACIVSRTVRITEDWDITVWEWEKTASVVETYWAVQNQGLALTEAPRIPQKPALLDPFGLVSWPGAVVAVQELYQRPQVVKGKKVLIVGAGVGLEAQACAQLGAKHVLATDIHPTTLQLLQYGAEQAGVQIETQRFDLFSSDPLPECDVMIVADVLYNERLAYQIAWRVAEARKLYQATVLVSDSQRFALHFETDLARRLLRIDKPPQPVWEPRWLPTFTGSGILIDEDQTYDVKARIMWLGLKNYVPKMDSQQVNSETNSSKASDDFSGRR